MRRYVSLCLLLSVLFTCISIDADAQFLRRLFGGKDKHQKRTYTKRPPVKEKKQPELKKRVEPVYPATVLKNHYRVDVFTALYLDELVKDGKPTIKGKVPDKSINGFDFYQGVKLATDSLNKLGYSIDIYVHDITSNNEPFANLVASQALDSTDLIIGAVPTSNVYAIADYCKKRHINFVSATSPSDAGVRNNPYFIMMQPSLTANCEWLMSAVTRKHKKEKPLVLYRKTGVDSNALAYLNIQNASVNTLSCATLPSREVLAPFLDSAKTNVLVVPIVDVKYAESLLVKIYTDFPGYNFEVYGMPTWKGMPALKKHDAFPNIAINITMPFYFDLSLPSSIAIARNYKRETSVASPPEMVLRGYETMYWYASLLRNYGTIFNKNVDNNLNASLTRYEIKSRFDKNDNFLYLENKHLYLMRYQAGSYTIEQ